MTSNYYGGLSGLVNLETPAMNAANQCLSNTEELTHYFLSKSFVTDFNKEKKTNRLAKEWYKPLNGLHEENCIVSPQVFIELLWRFQMNRVFILVYKPKRCKSF